MSKHSKWSKVKNVKGAADAKRANIFAKLGRGITVAAKEGGPDPAMNFKLRIAIDKAKAASMPKDTIERAVARGAGTAGGEAIEEVVYEGFGPGGTALMVHALTDNRNRTLMNVRSLFGKHGGNLGGQNSVAWMFERKGVIRVPHAASAANEQILRLIDAGAEDVHEEDEGFTVLTASEDLEKVKAGIETAGMAVEFAEISTIPKEKVHLPDAGTRSKLEALLEALDEDEDVDDVVTNVDL